MDDSGNKSPASAPVPAGNYYDKYASRNPVERFLVQRFAAAFLDMVCAGAPQRILDIGCGEGEMTRRVCAALPHALVVGADIDADFLAQFTRHNVQRLVAAALPRLWSMSKTPKPLCAPWPRPPGAVQWCPFPWSPGGA